MENLNCDYKVINNSAILSYVLDGNVSLMKKKANLIESVDKLRVCVHVDENTRKYG